MAHNNDYTLIWAQANNGLDMEEIRLALNESTLDLGKLCTSNNINMLSRRKPTDYRGLDSDDDKQPQGYIENTKQYSIDYYQIKPTNVFGVSYDRMNLVSRQSSGQYYIPPENILWNYYKPTPFYISYRQLDFDGYLAKNGMYYPYSGCDEPYMWSIWPKYDASTDKIVINVSMRITGKDAEYISYTKAKLLGLRSIFYNVDRDTNIYPGFFLYAKASESIHRHNNICMYYVSSTPILESTSLIEFNATVDNLIQSYEDQEALNSNFLVGQGVSGQDRLHFLPFIALYQYPTSTGSTKQWFFTPFGASPEPGISWSGSLSRDKHYYSSVDWTVVIKYTAYVDTDGSIYFYIANANDATFSNRFGTTTATYYNKRPFTVFAESNSIVGPHTNVASIGSTMIVGSQDVAFTGDCYVLSATNGDATIFSGWSDTGDIRTRVGTIKVIPTLNPPAATPCKCRLRANLNGMGQMIQSTDANSPLIDVETISTGDYPFTVRV